MADNTPAACGPCATGPGLLGGAGFRILKEGLWTNNAVRIQLLGICSALAVTNRLENSLVMGLALIFVISLSNVSVSLLRNITPRRIRMIAEMAIISTFVIVFDQLLKGFYWEMSKNLGPYVGLIITNCIVMGRAEAFAMQNKPIPSFADGITMGVGYALVLAAIGLIRELLGTGRLFNFQLLDGGWYTPNQIMILAPGAFFALGFLMALMNALSKPQQENKS